MPTKIIFLLLPHLHLMDLAGADQVFLEAKDFGLDIEVHHCSYSNSITTSSGLVINQLKHYSKIKCNAGDFIFIPGADINFLHSKEFKQQKELLLWIAQNYENQVHICSICTGAFVLAQSGILNGKNCTTHWKRTEELQKLFPKINVIENVLFTSEHRIYTSAGVASGIDMALNIIEELKDEYVAHKIARELVVYNRRKGYQSQHTIYTNYRNHIHAGIHKVQDWLQDNLYKKANLLELAEIATMSARNFTRVFKKETGLTVVEYTNLLRKEKINELINNPDLSRLQIAKACGLKSERHLYRLLNFN